MVKIEVNGPNVYTETDGEIIDVCIEAVLAMNGIYRHIVEDRPDMAGPLQAVILKHIATGMMFEDHDESGTLDDIPVQQKSAQVPETQEADNNSNTR